MATATKKTETAAPIPTFGTGKFAFAPTVADVIPEPPTTAPRTTRSPIMDFFDYCLGLGSAKAHGQTIFVPNSFWTAPKEEGGRGLEKLPNGGNVRTKLRDSWKGWVKADETIRACMGLLVIERKAGESGPGDTVFEEAGYSLFVVDKART